VCAVQQCLSCLDRLTDSRHSSAAICTHAVLRQPFCNVGDLIRLASGKNGVVLLLTASIIYSGSLEDIRGVGRATAVRGTQYKGLFVWQNCRLELGAFSCVCVCVCAGNLQSSQNNTRRTAFLL